MSDPRLNSGHLGQTRCDHYRVARRELLEARGPLTFAAEEASKASPNANGVRPTDNRINNGSYVLVNLEDGLRYTLRIGLNAVGRFPENDIVVKRSSISRRHCVFLVHATGGCEVYDTASRNGTIVNHSRVAHAKLIVGDIIFLCGLRFVLASEDSSEAIANPGRAEDTACLPEHDSTSQSHS